MASTQLLTPPQTADRLQIPLRTLDMWRYRHQGPAWRKVGRHIRYLESDIDSWLEDLKRGGPS